ncbi:Lrp/AsnC family transcriptional regulator [Sphingobacterium paucimobilis]|uniref:HTH asnC-type domain-containing protein n=1 Tax=Sphingobacterium paucimobilis HER1398 TaxID=1346330 RepID=U2HU36_9SPHI|nr:Lrp/AsnC family transcriptional regulator [Sphingobacterium paucimobilis]ERJ59022.1 hypothetical protein M472_09590 [Sphingobacterium paucimobilis HER1398]
MTKLDQIDITLLQLLQEDGTITKKELADRVHRSLAVVHERIRSLRTRGYIKRIGAVLDRGKVGFGVVSFSQVFLDNHSPLALQEFENTIMEFSEVIECFQIAGSYDFLLRIATSDMASYNRFLRERLAVVPAIDRIQSFFVLSESKNDMIYPLPID